VKNNNKSNRPFCVTLLGILVLIVAVLNLARGVQAFLSRDLLTGLLPISHVYLIASGLFWGFAGFMTALWLWFGWKLAPQLTLLFLGAYSLFYWVERLGLPGYAGRNMNWPFSVILNLLILAWSVWVLSRPRAKMFFEGSDERRFKSAKATRV